MKNLQPKGQGNWNKEIEEVTTPRVTETIRRQLKNFQTKLQRNLTMHMKNKLPKGQENRNKATEDITTQSVKNTVTRQMKNLKTKGQGHCNTTTEEIITQRSRNL